MDSKVHKEYYYMGSGILCKTIVSNQGFMLQLQIQVCAETQKWQIHVQ